MTSVSQPPAWMAAMFQKYAEPLAPPTMPAPPKPPAPPKLEPPKLAPPNLATPPKPPTSVLPAPTPPAAPPPMPAPRATANTPVPTTAGPMPATPTGPAPTPAPAPETDSPALQAARNELGFGRTVQTNPNGAADGSQPLNVQSSPDKQLQSEILDLTKPVDVQAVSGMLTDNRLSPEQRGELGTSVAQRYIQGNPDGLKGFQDVQAGKNTPQAQAFQAQLQKAQDEFIQQQVQADPEKAATPQGFGEMVNGAINTFQNMPPAMQALVGIGLPVGLIGIMSSLFGQGGAGMGILGLLGLGAAGLGGAAGGLFGQGAQDTANQGLFNVGSFLGMVPESQDLSVLMADDPVAAAAKGSGGGVGAFSGASAVKKTVAEAQAKRQQLERLLALPPAMQRTFVMNMDRKNIRTPADADRALANARQVLSAFDDPTSAIGQQLGQAGNYTDGGKTWTGRLGQIVDMARGLGDTSAWTAAPKQSAWRPKYAFNAVDQKELADLQRQRSEGVPHRPEDARREHHLQLRQQAARKPLAKRVTIVLCMKSARCWAGYEPVPGKKPYSDDSCRPVGSKKKKKKKAEKKAAGPGLSSSASPPAQRFSQTPFDAQHMIQTLGLPASTKPQMAYNRAMALWQKNKFTPAQFETLREKYQGLPPQFTPPAPAAGADHAYQQWRTAQGL